jgi:hypothetical protein
MRSARVQAHLKVAGLVGALNKHRHGKVLLVLN